MNNKVTPNFPTELHEQAVLAARDFFLQQQHVDTILLVNSLARGKATPESDIDMVVLVLENSSPAQIKTLEGGWQYFLKTEPILIKHKDSSSSTQIQLDIINGVFKPAPFEEGGPIDFLEVEIGNRIVYSAPLTDEGEYFKKLKLKWLPYYDGTLQTERLKMAKDACIYDLDHIPYFIKRGLYFHAFDRLYKAFQEFLQALHISHKIYPIAYNKWIKEQIVDILKLPELYKELTQILSVSNIESEELNEKAKALRILLEKYCK